MIDPYSFAVYFGLTTINVIAMTLHEDPNFLIYSMIPYRLFIILWGIRYFQKQSKSIEVKPFSFWACVAFSIPLLANVAFYLGKAPHNWESNLWSIMVDFLVVLGMWTNCSVSEIRQLVLFFFVNFYSAAAFWKINTHFLDYKASCATVFLAQHLAQYGPFILSLLGQPKTDAATLTPLMKYLAPSAPIGALAVELAMGIAMVWAWLLPEQSTFRSRVLRMALGIVLAFHFAVCVTPEPHDICQFAAQCACRLTFVVPGTLAWETILVTLGKWWKTITSVALVIVAYGIQTSFTPQNWHGVLFILAAPMILVAMNMKDNSPYRSPMKKKRKSRYPLWMTLAHGAAVFYAYGTIVLGLMEEATPNMFANLKIHGGSNHLLLPTGLLFHQFSEDPSTSGGASLWGGGVIRLESTTSNWLTEIYPSDLTHDLKPAATVEKLLQETCEAPLASYFNSGANRVLGLREKGWVPPPPHGQVIPYTVPALEWRRLLREATTKDGSFEVVYAHLEGTHGDEEWRAFSWEKKVKVIFVDGKLEACHVLQKNDDGKWAPCQSNELPYHIHNVPRWLSKLSMYHGYPLLFNEDGSPKSSIACFGP